MVGQADRYLINSVLRAAQILQSFSFAKSTYTNAELSKKLGLNRSTVTRLLYSLEKAGFVERDLKTNEYRLTQELYRIGNIYIHQIDLHREAMPLLSDLAASSKETAHLAILHESEVFFLDRVQSPHSIRLRSLAGNKLPAYCTSIGKVLLAHLNEEDLDAFFKTVKLEPVTPNTITDPERLRRHLEGVKAQGYAVDNIEYEPEVKSAACPIFDNRGRVVAAISLAGPVFRMSQKRMSKEIIPALIRTASLISTRLGFQGGIRNVS